MFQKYQKLSGISQRHNVAKTAERPGVTQMAERSKRINLALCQVISAVLDDSTLARTSLRWRSILHTEGAAVFVGCVK